LLIVSIILFSQEAKGQIQITLKMKRTLYLLYEAVPVEVSVTNLAGYDLLLEGDETRPWLSFIILRPDNSSIRPDQSYDLPPVELKPGQTRSFTVNITPLYAFRDTGSYRVKAVVSVAGKEFVTAPIEFSVANGHTVWKETRPVEGSDRIYSLVRFNYNMESTGLYLRVEDEKENLVYVTHPIGEIVTYTAPRTAFDNEGRLHILHVIGTGQHRYTVASPSGAILNREEYESLGEISPALIPQPDGTITLFGVKPRPLDQRERLSETQLNLAASLPTGASKTLPQNTKNKRSPKLASTDEKIETAPSPNQKRRKATEETGLPSGRLF
jgi:hypothetical protein